MGTVKLFKQILKSWAVEFCSFDVMNGHKSIQRCFQESGAFHFFFWSLVLVGWVFFLSFFVHFLRFFFFKFESLVRVQFVCLQCQDFGEDVEIDLRKKFSFCLCKLCLSLTLTASQPSSSLHHHHHPNHCLYCFPASLQTILIFFFKLSVNDYFHNYYY